MTILSPVIRISGRKFASSTEGLRSACSTGRLRSMYEKARENVDNIPLVPRVNPRAVFVNNELNLSKIKVYGFDYDYTLAVYTRELNTLIYQLAVSRLTMHYNYPRELLSVPYDHQFAIRGLHFDVENCCLLKVDAFSQIQRGTVFRGRKKLSDLEVRNMYGGFTLPDAKGRQFPQLIDLFSLPWAGLLATTIQFFDDNGIEFDPSVLYQDVADSVGHVHVSGEMYSEVQANLKKNSGMEYMLGSEWRQLFAHVVVSAKKPGFFSGCAPFRRYDEQSGKLSYGKINRLEPGQIYSGGNIDELSRLAEFGNKGVLYFGDHIYTDLADPMLRLGWGTAAIVPELAREIRSQNEEYYQKKVLWLETLTQLIGREMTTSAGDDEARAIVAEWEMERGLIREEIKTVFNPQFGSLFRTYHSMTFFSRRLCRLADIYTSRLPNLLSYDTEQAFFPRRNALPHENMSAVPVASDRVLKDVAASHNETFNTSINA